MDGNGMVMGRLVMSGRGNGLDCRRLQGPGGVVMIGDSNGLWCGMVHARGCGVALGVVVIGGH